MKSPRGAKPAPDITDMTVDFHRRLSGETRPEIPRPFWTGSTRQQHLIVLGCFTTERRWGAVVNALAGSRGQNEIKTGRGRFMEKAQASLPQAGSQSAAHGCDHRRDRCEAAPATKADAQRLTEPVHRRRFEKPERWPDRDVEVRRSRRIRSFGGRGLGHRAYPTTIETGEALCAPVGVGYTPPRTAPQYCGQPTNRLHNRHATAQKGVCS